MNTAAPSTPAKPPQVFTLQEAVSCQEGSVVSRTLIDKKAGTLTLFAFDSGQQLSTHSAPYDAFVQVVDGKMDIIIDDDTYTLASGDCIIMPANHPHSVHAVAPSRMFLVLVREKSVS